MKKIRLFTLFSLIMALTMILFVGCKKQDRISSVSLKDHDPNSVIEMPVGEFNYGAYTLIVSYESGKTEEIALSESMIAEEDLFKFYQVGDHDITAVYEKQKYTFKISVKRSTFGELSLPENNVFTYDGKYHTVEVVGDLPANATVTYPGGNSFINAGTYDVNAIVSCEGYVTVRLSTTVKINRAVYDMSGVKFEPKEYVYDGQSHSVEISGTLPEGISKPIYVINEKVTSSAVNVGKYDVTATFSHKNPNYEPIPNMVTTLTIIPADYTIRGVDVVFRDANGKSIENGIKVYDGTVVTFDLNDYNKLSSKISVTFGVYDAAEQLISSSNKNTKIVDAGVYTVKVSFTLADGKNYNPIDPIVRKFEVEKADYPLADIELNSERVIYNGSAHSLKISGKLPTDVSVSYEYYLNDELLKDSAGKLVESVVDAGRYTVKAIFTHTDKNRNEIAPLSAVMQIAQATVDTSSLVIEAQGDLVYDGTPKSVIAVATLPEGVLVSYEYYLNGKLIKNTDGTAATSVVEAGEYTVFIVFNVTNKNYLPISVMNYTLSVEKSEIDVSVIEIEGAEKYVYSGSEYAPSIKSATVPAGVNLTQALYSLDIAGNRTAITSAKNVGRYVMVFNLTPKDQTNYSVSADEIEWEFTIDPQPIDVSTIELQNATVTYDTTDHLPNVLKGIPAHVNVTVTAYSSNGTTPLTELINAGEYRVEVELAVDSANYVLSSAEKLVLDFKILQKTIDVSGLNTEFTFVYDGKEHLPGWEDLDPNVNIINKFLYLVVSEERIPIDKAVSAGTYQYDFTFSLSSSNYVLNGATTYSIRFDIQSQKIDIDPLLAGENTLKLVEGGYTAETIGAALSKVFFGDISEYITCSVSSIYSLDEKAYVDVDQIKVGGKYEIVCVLTGASDTIGNIVLYNYSLTYTHQSGVPIVANETSPKAFVFVIV